MNAFYGIRLMYEYNPSLRDAAPKTLNLKTATAMFAETAEYLQHPAQLILGSRSYTSSLSHENPRARVMKSGHSVPLHFLGVPEEMLSL
jgi:hypothetical protein